MRKRLLLYLLVFAGCSVWGLLARAVHALSAAHANTPFVVALMRLDAALGPSQGFFNAIVYGLNAKMRARLVRGCCGACGCCGGTQQHGDGGDGGDEREAGLMGSKFSQTTSDEELDGEGGFASPLRNGHNLSVDEVYGTPGTGADDDDPGAVFLQRDGGARVGEEDDDGLEGGGPYYAYYEQE